ncbi:MAG: RimK family alpha-L-glutamate ligase [Gammaproteobacteria bacterium]
MHIVFATCLTQPAISTSDSILARALEQRGVTVSGAPWNGAFEPFTQADGVLIRTTWDYFDHFPEFQLWLNQLETQGVRVQNSLATLHWNIHKSYLFDLHNAGAPVLPMVAVEPKVASVQAAASQHGWRKAVLKCLVSGTARGLSLFDSDSVEDIAKAIEVAQPWSEFGLVVQPFMPQIKTAGELSMVFVDGRFAHAVCKTPKAEEFRIQSEFGGRYERVQPSEQALGAAAVCLEHAANKLDEWPLYARVDGLIIEDAFKLMELELAEPELMFNLAPDAAELMADALLARMS